MPAQMATGAFAALLSASPAGSFMHHTLFADLSDVASAFAALSPSQQAELKHLLNPTIVAQASARQRTGSIKRKTKETSIEADFLLDGKGESTAETGVGFLNHMVQQLSKHGSFDIRLVCKGDLHIDDHHTVEGTVLN